jgi:tetratricopeptide (TPR) repeat protein
MHFTVKALLAKFFLKRDKFNRIKIFIVILGFLSVVCIGCLIYFLKYCKINEVSSEKLTEAYVAYAKGDLEKGITILDEIIINFRKTPASYQARLLKADIFTELHAYNDALQILLEIISNGKPDIIKPLASARVIYVYDLKKDYFNAILASKEFIDKYSGHFLVKDIYLNLAEYYLLLGSKDQAVKVFNEVLFNFPATEEAEKAKNRLNSIKQWGVIKKL